MLVLCRLPEAMCYARLCSPVMPNQTPSHQITTHDDAANKCDQYSDESGFYRYSYGYSLRPLELPIAPSTKVTTNIVNSMGIV